jgi:hypothetical protein
MRFRVIDILALTLLLGLALAIVAKRQAISATALELATLRAVTDRAVDDCKQKEHEIELLARTINRRATDLNLLSPTVDRVADLLNQAVLSTVEPTPHEDTVSRRIIPTYSRQGEFRERTKIYVPANLVCELQVKFVDNDGNPGFFDDFEAPQRHSVPLAFGENLIEVLFDWNQVPNIFTLTNQTNAVSIRARAKDVRGEGWSPALGQGFYSLGSFSLQRGMTIFEGGMGFKYGTRIVVQMVASKEQ